MSALPASSSAWRDGSRERARGVTAVLRVRRSRAFRPSLYQVYVTLLGIAIYGALTGHLISTAVGRGLGATALGGWGPGVLMLLLLGVVRSGTWQGPVVFSRGDVAFVLAAPIALVDLVRPRLLAALGVAGALGCVAGLVAVPVSAAGFAGLGVARCAGSVVACALLGVLAVASSWLVERSSLAARLVLVWTPLVAALGVAAILAGVSGATGRGVAVWSGPWGWALAPVIGIRAWWLGVALMAVCGGAAVVLAVRLAGHAATERFLAQAETRSAMAASAVALDYRSAALAHRAAVFTGRSHRRGLMRRPRRAGLVVLWRDTVAFVRAPWRGLWAAALCVAGVLEAVAHPGRPLPAALAAVALYFAAGALLEPLRVDVDSSETSRLLLSWRFARVLVAHCVLPVLVLSAVAAVTVAADVAVGGAGAGTGLLAVIPSLVVPLLACAVLCAALAARSGGRIGGSVLLRVMTTAAIDPLGGASAVIFVAPFLLLEIVLLAVPVLLVGHAAAHHRPLGGVGAASTLLAYALAYALLANASRSRPPAE